MAPIGSISSSRWLLQRLIRFFRRIFQWLQMISQASTSQPARHWLEYESYIPTPALYAEARLPECLVVEQFEFRGAVQDASLFTYTSPPSRNGTVVNFEVSPLEIS